MEGERETFLKSRRNTLSTTHGSKMLEEFKHFRLDTFATLQIL